MCWYFTERSASVTHRPLTGHVGLSKISRRVSITSARSHDWMSGEQAVTLSILVDKLTEDSLTYLV